MQSLQISDRKHWLRKNSKNHCLLIRGNKRNTDQWASTKHHMEDFSRHNSSLIGRTIMSMLHMVHVRNKISHFKLLVTKATLTLARILVYAWFAHWLVPFRVNAGKIRGNVREDAEQCGQCVKCLTKISKCLKFVHDNIFEIISRTIRELCVNYAQTSRTYQILWGTKIRAMRPRAPTLWRIDWKIRPFWNIFSNC